jgi:ribosomal protein L7Ae-like RNA K-turn-binding protein
VPLNRRRTEKSLKTDTGIDPLLAVWRILGLAVRAGQVQTGAEAAEQAVRRNKARLVLIAADAAGNTTGRLLNKCLRENIPVRQLGSKADLGHWTGKADRAVAVVLDAGFAGRILELADRSEDSQ